MVTCNYINIDDLIRPTEDKLLDKVKAMVL